VRIVGFAASLRAESYLHRLLGAAGHELPAGTDFEIWQGLERVPPRASAPGSGPVPGVVDGLLRAVARSDGLLVMTPGQSLLPHQLAHALDWMANGPDGSLVTGLPVVLVSASASAFGAMWVQVELRPILSGAGAVVRGTELTISPEHPQFDAAGRLLAGDSRDRLRAVVAEPWTPFTDGAVVPPPPCDRAAATGRSR
jgi:NAD(P)H-dependent FMN reductase